MTAPRMTQEIAYLLSKAKDDGIFFDVQKVKRSDHDRTKVYVQMSDGTTYSATIRRCSEELK